MKPFLTPLLILVLSTSLAASSAVARTPVGDEVFGIGIQLGDPSGLTMKLLPSDVFGFQAYIGGGGWRWGDDWGNMFITGADLIFHPVMIYDGWKTCALNLTLGAGAALGVFRGWYRTQDYDRWHYDRYYYRDSYYATLFIRMVTGVSLWFKKFPLETFVELNPALHFINPTFGFNMFFVGAGGRWYF